MSSYVFINVFICIHAAFIPPCDFVRHPIRHPDLGSKFIWFHMFIIWFFRPDYIGSKGHRQFIVRHGKKNTNNKEIFKTLVQHHLKEAFGQSMCGILEERGLFEFVDKRNQDFLSQYVDKNRYEQGMRFPVLKAAASPEKLHMREKVGIYYTYLHIWLSCLHIITHFYTC